MLDDIVEILLDIATDLGGFFWGKKKEKKKQQEARDELERQKDRERPL